MTEPTLPFVSVLMPVRNEVAFIERSLGAVLRQTYPADRMEILVADGLSDDGTAESVASLTKADARIRLLRNPGKIVSTGLNTALTKARGDIVIRIDGHCEVAPDYVIRCVEHLLRGEADAVGGPLETVGEDELSRTIAIAMSSVFGVGGVAFRTTTGWSGLVDTVAFPAFTRFVIDRTGPFDEELVRNQDDEYNYRLRELGGRILLSASVRCRYFSRSSLRSLWRQYFQYGYWKVRVMQKHPAQMRWRQFVPPLFTGFLLVSALFSPIHALARWLFAGVLAAYLVANLLATFSSVSRGSWPAVALLPVAFAAMHFAYGLGFLRGLIAFRDRWEDRGTQPPVRCEEITELKLS
ncbi:MAG: glycosyltransferase family 2 protein [Acidobacteriota bacterium]|nr:glycosyltransferase family 2 protein [Acidobacteriota bacterium]